MPRRETLAHMTALTMSNTLSALDLSELSEPYVRRVPCSAPSPAASPSCSPTPPAPATATPLDVWIAASQGPPHNNQTPDHQPQLPPNTPVDSSNPNDLFSSFLPATPRSHPLVKPQPTPHLVIPQTSSDHPIHVSHLQQPPPSIPQPDRMIYTTPLRTTPPQQNPAPTHTAPAHPPPQQPNPTQTPLSTPLLTPIFSNPSDGLSAVERAKKSADHFTMSQLAKKRKAAGLDPDPKRARNISSSKSSTDDDDKHDQNLPEKISHRKYQKRLQKNRDSAFVSRIRRREYTRLLEESLATTEKEKEAAVSSFLEMKRRFDIVSAELSAFKQAAASNLSAVRESLFSHLSTTTSDTQPVRSGTVVTSMFMFTLLFGILLPDCIRQRFGLQRYSPDSHQSLDGVFPDLGSTQYTGIRSMLFGNIFSKDSHHINESRGKVWGQSTGTVHLDDDDDDDDDDDNNNTLDEDGSCHAATLKSIQSSSLELLGEEHSEHFLKLAEPYIERLSSEQLVRLRDVFAHGNSTRFEQLVEIEAVARKVGRQRLSDTESLLEHVTLQLENARL